MPPACFLNAPTLGNSPVPSKGEVPTCDGAQFYCLVLPLSIHFRAATACAALVYGSPRPRGFTRGAAAPLVSPEKGNF